jgi:hypothetical protein
MNEQAQALLRKAEECENAAQRTCDDEIRVTYLELARQWRTLAEHAHKMDWLRGPNGGS